MKRTFSKRPSGMIGLTVVLAGQAISILASSMTGFALSLWVYQQTSSATSLGIMTTAFTVPYLLIMPLAGVMVDRYNRKLMMAVSDLAAGLGTLTILILYLTGRLEIWHFYAVNLLVGLGNAFQWPAYSAAITTMVPKEQYGRANGMMGVVEAGPGIVAPLLAGALMPVIGLAGILFFDVATFVLAIGALLLVVVPPPIQTVEGQAGKGSFWQEATYGFKYIFQRPSLVGIVLMLFISNFFLGFPNSVEVPLILSRTGNNSLIFGSVMSASAIAWTAGSLAVSAWGGPKRRIHGFLLGWIICGVFGTIVFGLGRGVGIWIPAVVVASFAANVGTISSTAILQAKVAPDVQGRVFTARRLLTWFPDTFTPILGGLLADRVMEPAMRSGGGLANLFGWMVGIGPGSGMAIMMIVSGGLMIIAMSCGYIFPVIRNMEDLLPDHDQYSAAQVEKTERAQLAAEQVA